jgi:hypothetical protein
MRLEVMPGTRHGWLRGKDDDVNSLMTSKNLVGLILLLGAAGCSATADDGGAPAQGGTDTSTGSSGAPSDGSSAPAYSVSCDGEVSKLTNAMIGANVAPRCVGADPDSGTFGCDDPCDAQEVSFTYAPPALRCGATDVWTWDGEACVAHPTQTAEGAMTCTGAGCPNLFKTEEACEQAYGHCGAK